MCAERVRGVNNGGDAATVVLLQDNTILRIKRIVNTKISESPEITIQGIKVSQKLKIYL